MTKVLIYSVLIVLLVVGFILKWGSVFAIIPKKEAEEYKYMDKLRKFGFATVYLRVLIPFAIFVLACIAYLIFS